MTEPKARCVLKIERKPKILSYAMPNYVHLLKTELYMECDQILNKNIRFVFKVGSVMA